MSDRSTFDAFELRLAGELERYVAAAADPKPPAEIAAVAMRPRGLAARARNASSRRRLLLIGLAATFLVPAALIGAGSIRPAPLPPDRALPARTEDARPSALPSAAPPSAALPQGAEAIFVRRANAPEPGVSIFAVRPDGAEVLIRHVPDSLVSDGTLSEWGTVGGSGWLALPVEKQGGPWPMVLVDLSDPAAQPWVLPEANTGAIGPRWGPTGLIAVDTGNVGGTILIADPETRQTRTVTMPGGLVGGGPSIVWTADGGIVSSNGDGEYKTVPADGGASRPGVGDVFEPRAVWGDGLATLRTCTGDEACPGPADGRIERVETDGSARTIWRQSGNDRALAAGFGRGDDYWLTVDHSGGRQVTIVHVSPGRDEAVATLNRGATWQYVGAPEPSPDGSLTVVWIDIGAKPAAVVVPFDGTPQTYHTGQFAGFVDRSVLPMSATAAPGATLPPIGKPFPLPSLEQLIAAELAINPGERVLGKASHDGIEGDTTIRTTEIKTAMPGGQVYLDCRGPASATLTTGAGSTTSPCLNVGSYGIDAGSNAPITVTARGDMSWRVVVYAPAPPSAGDTPAPVSGP